MLCLFAADPPVLGVRHGVAALLVDGERGQTSGTVLFNFLRRDLCGEVVVDHRVGVW